METMVKSSVSPHHAVNCSPWHQTGRTIYSTCAICRHAWVVKMKRASTALLQTTPSATATSTPLAPSPSPEFCAEEHRPRTHAKRKGASHQHIELAIGVGDEGGQAAHGASVKTRSAHAQLAILTREKQNKPTANKQKRRANNSSRT